MGLLIGGADQCPIQQSPDAVGSGGLAPISIHSSHQNPIFVRLQMPADCLSGISSHVTIGSSDFFRHKNGMQIDCQTTLYPFLSEDRSKSLGTMSGLSTITFRASFAKRSVVDTGL